ncbi:MULTISPECIES: SAF domain-containing protein [unclassified Crossiella]|uniref:SAF domain-containing protein n=1 Tax=unclassified Crossiella TaxID=2620835 RepID=UPI001FFF34B7|nr:MULTISPECIES: SAF domain-containing protein [unclassified Crossiella]MCK2243697.1 SAF domain-containing protein [Crossiella sp. S99.2]MCK2257556.1 SAF domain-containing protein [Crossiella sp. S99.1]
MRPPLPSAPAAARNSAAPQAARSDHPARLPRRRRWWLLLTALGLAAGAGYGNYLFISAHDARVTVLVLARQVDWGQRITETDLVTARIVEDPAAHMIRDEDRAAVLGKTAATGLPQGSVLAPEHLTADLIPAAGQHVVGLAVKPGQLPARGLRPGERVQVTPIASNQTTAEGAIRGTGFTARVLLLGKPDTQGAITVDVVITADQLTTATAAAAGPVILTLLGPGN